MAGDADLRRRIGWSMLPLRGFLGVTFCFAGLQKLANPNFFDAQSPISIQSQLIAAERTSPLRPLLGHLLHLATPLGVFIALAELAVGIGTVLGLWSRVAAAGGALLSLSLFLTVSYHASPYYTGADIVFLFAWLPLVAGGSWGVVSVDQWIATRSAALPLHSPPVHSPRAPQRSASGPGDPADPVHQPDDAVRPNDLVRRRLVLGLFTSLAAGALGLISAGLAMAVGRAVDGAPRAPSGAVALRPSKSRVAASPSGHAPSSASSATSAPQPQHSGTAIGAAKEVPVGGAATFTDPGTGDPALVLQPEPGTFRAYDAVCPHAGCTVGYSRSAKLLVCPCHGSQFDPATGAVEVGPADRGLGRISITEGADGQLYVE